MESSDLQEYARQAGLVRPSILWEPLTPSGPALTLDADRPVYPASTIKTPLAAAAFLLAERGKLALDERRPVRAENRTLNDAPSPIEPGYPASIAELCRYAIDRSDNVATNELFDRLGREEATAIVREELGLEATGFFRKLSGSDPLIADPQWDGKHRNAHPVRDAARLFRQIAERAFPGAETIEGWLAEQRWNDKLSLGLAPGDRFAHKTGDTSEVTHDGGILTTGDRRRAAIVVYTEMPSTPENNARFGTFMRLLRNEAFRDST
uniref:Beta-lactamase class A catalytic domain-containing protein n=1 Tax=mine drainage metagenome TaxID=410659 RepID=E6PJ18_9ZZZZ